MTDVSAKLGEYMLKGWVLTDSVCPTPRCNVPLMRSPKGQSPVVHFCANCDSDPRSSSKPAPIQTSSTPATTSVSSQSHASRPSTPPTEISSSLSSPTFMPPPESEASIRRRQQSDRASTEIGKLLLKGWAMLAEECPNPECFGVPLVRPPNQVKGTKDQKMECVVCRGIYVAQQDSRGFETLVSIEGTIAKPPTSAAVGSNAAASTQEQSSPHGLATTQAQIQTPVPVVNPANTITTVPSLVQSPSGSGVDASVQALDLTLLALSQKLTDAIHGGGPLDLAAVGLIADTMAKVGQSLSVLKQVQQYGRT
ncbi:hypothetical protein HGRIS_009780 [Hohenbuehelia grisea]|uniref:Uncharacterized protein n=1 Tax=Hohenbuehelia grisea TaxID=104357 RepID=A0ABR3J2C8_9AGAR